MLKTCTSESEMKWKWNESLHWFQKPFQVPTSDDNSINYGHHSDDDLLSTFDADGSQQDKHGSDDNLCKSNQPFPFYITQQPKILKQLVVGVSFIASFHHENIFPQIIRLTPERYIYKAYPQRLRTKLKHTVAKCFCLYANTVTLLLLTWMAEIRITFNQIQWHHLII